MSRPDWITSEIDLNQPSVARIYDYNLGGSHNFAVDRELADKINAAIPDLPAVNRANRSLLRRVVRFLTDEGIRQFLDLGSGIPTVGNVHEIAQQAAPGSKVAYVDVDPIAVAHSNTILAENPDALAVQADIRDIEYLLTHPQVRELIDFDRPVGVLVLAMMHFVPGDDAFRVVAAVRETILPGSYLALSHATSEGDDRGHVETVSRPGIGVTLRRSAELSRMLRAFELVEPGLVYAPQWRPDSPTDPFTDHPERSATLIGVAKKR
jgi:hypothetical protein